MIKRRCPQQTRSPVAVAVCWPLMRVWLWTWLTVDETFLEYMGRLSVGISGEKSALNVIIPRHFTHIARPAVIAAHFCDSALLAGF
jgi:hypothetical protein